jgi:hypothetical protein
MKIHKLLNYKTNKSQAQQRALYNSISWYILVFFKARRHPGLNPPSTNYRKRKKSQASKSQGVGLVILKIS